MGSHAQNLDAGPLGTPKRCFLHQMGAQVHFVHKRAFYGTKQPVAQRVKKPRGEAESLTTQSGGRVQTLP